MSGIKPKWNEIVIGATIKFESSLLDMDVQQKVVGKTIDGKKRRIHTDRFVVEYDRKDLELIVS